MNTVGVCTVSQFQQRQIALRVVSAPGIEPEDPESITPGEAAAAYFSKRMDAVAEDCISLRSVSGIVRKAAAGPPAWGCELPPTPALPCTARSNRPQ